MARWRLLEGHYIHLVEQDEWQYTETDRDTGRQKRKMYPVPSYLNPKMVNHDIIVCHKGKGQRGDIEFVGDPTPDMEPLDEEAEKISGKFKWAHPINDLPIGDGQSHSDAILAKFTQQLEAMMAQHGPPVSPATVGVSSDEFNELKGLVAQLMEQNAALQAQLGEKKARRI